MSKELRHYQTSAIEAINKSLSKGVVNNLLVMATGVGKTFTAVKAIQGKGRCCWGTHTEELAEQSSIAILAELNLMPYDVLIQTINENGGIVELLRNNKDDFFTSPNVKLITSNIGMVKADIFDIDKPYVVCSMQTLHRRLDRIPADWFDVVIADECHLFLSKTYKQSLDYLKPKLRLGLTASPFRLDGMAMGDLFDSLVYEYTIEQAIKDKYLCEPDCIQIKTTANLDNVHTLGGELNAKELTETVNTLVRNNLIVSKYIEYANGRQFIAFTVDVAHAQDLCEAFKEQGINCSFVVGDKELTTDRRGTIERFKSGEITGLTNVVVLTTGFDHANVGCVILAAPTKSTARYLQSFGRGLRLKDKTYTDKWGQACIFLDVVDVTTRHKLVNTYTLDKDKPIEEKVFISEKNRQLLLDVKAKREAQLTIVHREKDVKIDLFAIPVVKISGSMRMLEQASQAQLDWIATFGYDVVNVNYTKKMCSEIISMQPASAKEISFFKWKGYDVSNGVTKAEARLISDEIKLREENQRLQSQSKNMNLPFNF